MKIKITVGSVELTIDGMDLTKRDIGRLLRTAASIALAVDTEETPEETKQPMGFAAHMELDPERNLEPDLSEWFEESP